MRLQDAVSNGDTSISEALSTGGSPIPHHGRPHLPPGSVFKIPSHSFTAFRLRHCSTEEISRSSETILLGGIPDAWVRLRSSLVAQISHRKRLKKRLSRINSKFLALNQDFYDNYLRLGSNESCESSTSTESERIQTDSTESDTRNLFDLESRSSSAEERYSQIAPLKSPNTYGGYINDGILQSDSTAQDSSTSGQSLFEDQTVPENLILSLYDQIYQGQKKKEDLYTLNSPFNLELRGGQPGVDKAPNLSFCSVENELSVKIEPDSESLMNENLPTPSSQNLFNEATDTNSCSTVNADSQVSPIMHAVMFSETTPSLRKNNVIKNINPNPLIDSAISEDNSFPVQRHHWKLIDKLKSGAFYSKGIAAHELEKLEKRLRIQKFLLYFEVGEILKYEKMLVLVKETESEHFKGPLTEDECCDTRVSERWKEYIVVVRSNSDPDNPVFIQFKNKRDIDKKEEFSLHGIDFKVNMHTTHVSYYSTLDKTICISVPGHKENEHSFYILKLHTLSSANSWYKFLNDILSSKSKNLISLQIPELELRLDIRIPWDAFEAEGDGASADLLLTVSYKNSGYEIEKPKGLKIISDLIDGKLSSARNLQKESIKWDLIKEDIMICHRIFDRLEWHPQLNGVDLSDFVNLNATEVLELRRPVHYPRTATLESGEQLHEPTPIEGFLIRLTSSSGGARSGVLKRQVIKMEYFYSHDNLLMFCTGGDGAPPLPSTVTIDLNGYISDPNGFRDVIKDFPQIYKNNNFQLDSCNHFTWLFPEIALDDFQKHDLEGLLELQRRSSQTVQAKGIIDLCDIKSITSVPSKELSNHVRTTSSFLWTGSISSAVDLSKTGSCFEIHLNSGGRVRLYAPSNFIKNEWMTRLSELSDYWKIRKNLDKSNLMKLNQLNQKRLHLRDSEVASISLKLNWESLNATSDPLVYNISDIALTRCVYMSGFLYQKPKKHSNFRKFFALLSPNNITLYQLFRRSSTGNIKRNSGYRHYLTVAIHEAYVYSGAITSLDLLDRDTGIDRMHSTALSQPRVYDDGWMSSERQEDRSFTLWFGKKRAIAGESPESKFVSSLGIKHKKETLRNGTSSAMNPGFIKMVSRLGVTGKSVVFVARSRQERDLWVSRISNSAEKFYVPENEGISLH